MRLALSKLLLLCFLLCQGIVIAQVDTIPVTREVTNQKGQMELIQNEVSVKDIDIEPIDTQRVAKDVVPDTKKETRKIMKLFLKAMAVIALSAFLLYVILVFVKKFYRSAFVSQQIEDYENLDLATPQNKQDALKSFLNRVK